MKIWRIMLLWIISCFTLAACGTQPNMTELLAYETGNMSFEVKIQDDAEFFATLTLGEYDTIFFKDGDLDGICIEIADDGDVDLTYKNFKIPVPPTALLKAIHWKELFHLSEKNLLWKIKKETLGGLTVYTCSADNVTVYIDAATNLPLKITQGKIVIDILQSENLIPIEPKTD